MTGRGLVATFTVGSDDFTLDIELQVPAGRTVALLGPNGAGKTTTLRTLAGLIEIRTGRVELDGRVLEDTATGAYLPPAGRNIGVVFQDYLLFPHLDALDNVAFGLQARGSSRSEARSGARRWLERLGVGDLADRRPRQLSGGQQQRVALARSLATDPSMLLLDEPLAALDAASRAEIRSELRRHLAGFAGARVIVTHDPLEAMVLGDELVVLEQGRITQTGTPADVARHPRSAYVAELVGLNLLAGRSGPDHTVVLGSGGVLHTAEQASGEVLVAVRPQAVAIHAEHPEGSPRNVWQATVADLEADRDRVRIQLAGPVPLVAEVTTAAVAELGLVPGTEVWASVKAVELATYPA